MSWSQSDDRKIKSIANTMRSWALLGGITLLPTLGVQGIRIIHSNDDGWAELYTRSFYDALVSSGHDVVLSAPAENKSGSGTLSITYMHHLITTRALTSSGSLDLDPWPRLLPCQYNSCPANSGRTGRNESSPRLNWVNSFPVTSIRYGINEIAPQFWNGQLPELAVTGPNVGSNIYLADHISGTVGAATYAAKKAKIPAIAFSGKSTGTLAWNTSPVPQRSLVYADLAANLTNAVISSGKPYLPEDVFLNVNFPEVSESCNSPGKFKWVLSRVNLGVFSEDDVEWCGSKRLPSELEVTAKSGCYISVSVVDANDKTTAPAEKQAIVLQKLQHMLTCLP